MLFNPHLCKFAYIGQFEVPFVINSLYSKKKGLDAGKIVKYYKDFKSVYSEFQKKSKRNPLVNIINVWIERPPKDFKFHEEYFIVGEDELEYVFVQQSDVKTKAVDLTRKRSDHDKLSLMLQLAFATDVLQKFNKHHHNLEWKYVSEDITEENGQIVFIKPRYTQVSLVFFSKVTYQLS